MTVYVNGPKKKVYAITWRRILVALATVGFAALAIITREAASFGWVMPASLSLFSAAHL